MGEIDADDIPRELLAILLRVTWSILLAEQTLTIDVRGLTTHMPPRMVDNRSRESRSRLMSRVRGKDTKPEMVVRRLAHRLGYRFRLHRRDLPGRPDLVFPGRKKVIFVHGCYWHRHSCKLATTPKSNVEFWLTKFRENTRRDKRNLAALHKQGWDCMVLWQCEIERGEGLDDRLTSFLGGGR